MTTVIPDPDIENAVRLWARELDLPEVGANVFFGPPASDTGPPDSYITLYRVGGTKQAGEAPLTDPRISFNVYALTKKHARDAAGWLIGHLEAVTPFDMGSGVFCYGVTVGTMFWAPVPDSAYHRYVVDAAFKVRAT